jgi:hypothetical protein
MKSLTVLIAKILPVTFFRCSEAAKLTTKRLTGTCLWYEISCRKPPKVQLHGFFSLHSMRGRDWRKSTSTEIIKRLLEFFNELVSDFKEANRNFTYILLS